MANAPLITRVSKMSTETVRFSDGMIVTAEDLTVATKYPLELMQVLVRAYFGCGVVCGLSLGQDSRIGDRTPVKEDNCRPDNATYTTEIAAGVALDCAGYPLEVCGAVRIDLTPDPCAKPGPIVGNETRTLHIAIRRAHKADSAGQQGGCGCDCSEGEDCGDRDAQCSRLRDHVEVGVFEELPEDACRRPEERADERQVGADGRVRDAAGNIIQGESRRLSLCECLTQCPHCHCCGDNWVALGTVTIDKWGITERGIAHDTRRYVKPTECVCTQKEKALPPPQTPDRDETYSVKLDEYRNEQKARIGQLHERAETAEQRAIKMEKILDERSRQYEDLRKRMDKVEAQALKTSPGTKTVGLAPKKIAGDATGGTGRKP